MTIDTLVEAGASPALAAQMLWSLRSMRDPEFAWESERTIDERFSAAFLNSVPPDTLRQTRTALVTQLAGSSPEWLEQVSADSGSVLFEVEGTPMRLIVAVDSDDGRISGLLVQPALDLDPLELTSWDEVPAALAPLGGFATAWVGRVGADGCEALHASGPPNAMPLGSTFKLWVLLALVQQIDAGRLTWETPVEVRADLLSMPSGTMQDEAVGSTLSVHEVAVRMISISDNTATDHLVALLGRETIEATIAGVSPELAERNTPLLTTRDLFILKGTQPFVDRAFEWRSLSDEEQRMLLQSIADRDLSGFTMWTMPRWIDQLEWFATGPELCATMGALRASLDAHPALDEVLGTNPGVPAAQTGGWSRVWYKGGSEPGVLNMTWLLESPAGETWVVSLSLANLMTSPDTLRAVRVATAMMRLLADDVLSDSEGATSSRDPVRGQGYSGRILQGHEGLDCEEPEWTRPDRVVRTVHCVIASRVGIRQSYGQFGPAQW